MSSRKEANKARREKRKQRSETRLASHPRELGFTRGISGARDGVLVEPAGFEKMSVVLEEFARPFLDESDLTTLKGHWNLLNFAAAAWNITLFREEMQQEQVDEMVERVSEGESSEIRSGFRLLFERMIARKKAFFADNRRMIHKVHVSDTGRGFYVNVVSSPPLPTFNDGQSS